MNRAGLLPVLLLALRSTPLVAGLAGLLSAPVP